MQEIRENERKTKEERERLELSFLKRKTLAILA